MYDPDDIPEREVLNCFESQTIVEVQLRLLNRSTAKATAAIKALGQAMLFAQYGWRIEWIPPKVY